VKQLVYGDFFLYSNGTITNVLETQNAYIIPNHTPKDSIFDIPIMFRNLKIDDLHITLPCGMKNGSDNIEYLQTACGSSAYKSNNINIHVKNLNIDNENILNGVEESIVNSIRQFIPTNSKINNIVFQNFK
jgi:hypothetical protein